MNHLICSLRAKYERRWEKKHHLHTDHLKTIMPIEVGESLVIACITHLHSDDFLSVFLLSIFKQVTAQLLLAPPQVILVTCKSPFVVRFLKTGQVCHKKIYQKTSVNMNIKMNFTALSISFSIASIEKSYRHQHQESSLPCFPCQVLGTASFNMSIDIYKENY